MEGHADLAPQHELESAESSCPAELPGDQSAIDRSHRHALIGLGRCEVQRRQEQQVAGYEIERHAHSRRKTSACRNRSSQAAALAAQGRPRCTCWWRACRRCSPPKNRRALSPFVDHAIESITRVAVTSPLRPRSRCHFQAGEATVHGAHIERAGDADEGADSSGSAAWPRVLHPDSVPESAAALPRPTALPRVSVLVLATRAQACRSCTRRTPRVRQEPPTCTEEWSMRGRPAAVSSTCSRLRRTASAARCASSGRMCASPINTVVFAPACQVRTSRPFSL